MGSTQTKVIPTINITASATSTITTPIHRQQSSQSQENNETINREESETTVETEVDEIKETVVTTKNMTWSLECLIIDYFVVRCCVYTRKNNTIVTTYRNGIEINNTETN
jgi:hypothetical protein